MTIYDLPIRSNGVNVDASWWNDIRSVLLTFITGGSDSFVNTVHNFLDVQAATNLTGETIDGAAFTSAIYYFEAKRGTTVFGSGRFYCQYLNGTWRVTEPEYSGEDIGLLFSITTSTGVGQLKLQSTTTGNAGVLKLKRLLYAV